MDDRDFAKLVAEAFQRFEALTPEQKRAHLREQAISFAYGNLALTKNWKGTREDVARAYDELHNQGKVDAK